MSKHDSSLTQKDIDDLLGGDVIEDLSQEVLDDLIKPSSDDPLTDALEKSICKLDDFEWKEAEKYEEIKKELRESIEEPLCNEHIGGLILPEDHSNLYERMLELEKRVKALESKVIGNSNRKLK